MKYHTNISVQECIEFARRATPQYKANKLAYERQLRAERRFDFGQYKGRLIADIIVIDNAYVKWCLKNCLIKPKYAKE